MAKSTDKRKPVDLKSVHSRWMYCIIHNMIAFYIFFDFPAHQALLDS